MVLPVERAGIGLVGSSRHRDVRFEVHVLRHLRINGGLSVFHEGAERLPVSLRGDFVVVFFGDAYCHLPVGCYGGGGVEAVGKGDGIIMMRVVARA